MRHILIALAMIMAAAAPAPAQPAAQPSAQPVTIESYYRVKWGSAGEFFKLYERNEVSLLREMQRQGLITALSFDEPFTHMAGAPRWDFRARITYRDGNHAVETGGAYDKAFEAARARLLPDKARFEAEQAKRMSLLEDHWDVVMNGIEFERK
jgi:hypothetical protein